MIFDLLIDVKELKKKKKTWTSGGRALLTEWLRQFDKRVDCLSYAEVCDCRSDNNGSCLHSEIKNK